jgi:hypothetical protein
LGGQINLKPGHFQALEETALSFAVPEKWYRHVKHFVTAEHG